MVRASPCGPSSSASERSAGSPRQPSADVRNISRSRIVASTQRCPIPTITPLVRDKRAPSLCSLWLSSLQCTCQDSKTLEVM